MAGRRALSTSTNSSGAMLPLHRMSASITSWFQLPDQGMMQYEMLSRGTAFCVHPPAGKGGSPTSQVSAKSPLYFFTCSHVAAPWRWPKLYPLPWLEHVREEHTRCVLHVTEGKTGQVVERFLLQPTVVHHDSLDVCVLQLQDQEHAIRRMAKHGLRLEPLVLSSNVPAPGHPVVSPGFAVKREGKAAGSATDDDDDEEAGLLEDPETGETVHLDLRTDEEPRRLCVSMGTVNQYKDRHSRGFAAMDRVLGDGVCGAPLLDLREEGRCVGLVEGIVPPLGEGEEEEEEVEGMEPAARRALEVRRAIAGNAAFIYGRELVDLLARASSSDTK